MLLSGTEHRIFTFYRQLYTKNTDAGNQKNATIISRTDSRSIPLVLMESWVRLLSLQNIYEASLQNSAKHYVFFQL